MPKSQIILSAMMRLFLCVIVIALCTHDTFSNKCTIALEVLHLLRNTSYEGQVQYISTPMENEEHKCGKEYQKSLQNLATTSDKLKRAFGDLMNSIKAKNHECNTEEKSAKTFFRDLQKFVQHIRKTCRKRK